MDHKKLSIEAWEEMLKFLDRAKQQHKEKSCTVTDLDEKLAYINKSNQIEQARRTLFSLRFEIEDYVKTGSFEPSEIILEKPCIKCGKR